MDGKPGLQHLPGGGGLSLGSARGGIFARGRRDAANSDANPYYRDGVAAYNAGEFRRAAESFMLAAGQGHAEAQYLLGTMLEEGKGVEQDDAAADLWLRQAAEKGHAYAQAALSFRHYAAGDFAQAFAWCQRAADGRLAWAQYHLGSCTGRAKA